MTTPLSGVPGTSPSAASASTTRTPATSATEGPGLGQDAFMKLLVAQLKYQNPMAPADGQAYMTQMATFTQVEKLGQLVTAQTEVAQWQKRLTAEGMVGREVTGTLAEDAGGATVTGTVAGVRFTADGPVLELSDGRSLTVDAVSRVATPGATSPAASSSA